MVNNEKQLNFSELMGQGDRMGSEAGQSQQCTKELTDYLESRKLELQQIIKLVFQAVREVGIS